MVGPSKQASKQANIHTHMHNAVTLVWGSLRLAPISKKCTKWHLEQNGNNLLKEAVAKISITVTVEPPIPNVLLQTS